MIYPKHQTCNVRNKLLVYRKPFTLPSYRSVLISCIHSYRKNLILGKNYNKHVFKKYLNNEYLCSVPEQYKYFFHQSTQKKTWCEQINDNTITHRSTSMKIVRSVGITIFICFKLDYWKNNSNNLISAPLINALT